ncbi:putative ribonuclease H-like domain-containing protein [Tanacetum coccineum]|uniref:Ribonuclease H-like domain-containing protein n=1 Tax=Tanacetum coccineum TaxID=301880 RepID=A0ABQ5G4G3_9ASTR
MNFFRSRKVGMIWSFSVLGVCKSTKIPFVCEYGLTSEWDSEDLTELLERESDEFVLNHEGDKNDAGVISLKIIKNGNKVLKRTVGTVEREYEPTTAEEKHDRRNEVKARATLLMALPNKDQLNTNNTNNTNKADDTAHRVSTTHSTTHTQGNGVYSVCLDNLCDAVICAFLASQPNSPQLSQEDLKQLNPDDLEEMDLQWEMTMLTIRARRFIKITWKKLDINGQRVGFEKSKVECFNCHKHGHFARECRFLRNQEYKGRENNTRTIAVETPTQNALIARDGIGGYDWSYQTEEEEPTNHALMAFTSSGSSSTRSTKIQLAV